ncbi:GGDEF domain-containing protein [Aestuariirhabdus sp. Z084]|uniref:GGDEF domain-containing protein n=1 Tax=Aestuariirhabdus haliotis TaxID=2918751 RepID=UPI00201B3F93|nr:GGDEF domain-containing protein [Aestuariirhabdus haliotis]MCL6414029.1 GGDEF domain-containing protein [Aestuariirhabdus haliotis]MCL6417962.1 GGDEF domain-containing protein [Aestuariirhabdus haliotis]
MTLHRFFDVGIDHLGTGQSAYKIRVTNLVSIITSVIASGYLLFYWLALNSIALSLMNLGFVIAYLMPLLLMRLGWIRGAKSCFFIVLMLHVLVLTTVLMNRATGIHLYYFLVPAGVFLFFESDERRECLAFSLAAVLLFLICEQLGNKPSLIDMTDEQARWLLRSTVIVSLLEVYVVMLVFTGEIQKRERQLQHQATTDPLTGLANRRKLLNQGDVLCERSHRYGQPLSMLLMDLDHFKQINDHYGHTVGDTVLASLSGLMVQASRGSDIVARYGGEEFAVLLPGLHKAQAKSVAEKLRKLIEAHPIQIAKDHKILCTASIGVASVGDTQYSFDQLLGAADRALYLAKQGGRNRVECFDGAPA